MTSPKYAAKLLYALVLAALVAGCGGGGRPVTFTGTPPQTVQGDLPPPTVADGSMTNGRAFRIGPYDRLTIDVFGVTELAQREVQADASGRITYPLIGVVEAAGKTPFELAQTIAARLRTAFVRNPQVTVNLKETVSQTVTVDGEVREPGVYPVMGETSLLRVIARAKGTNENALQRNVLVYRSVNGEKLVGVYNLGAIRRGFAQDPQLYPNDVVVVSDNAARRLLLQVLGTIPIIVTPIILLLR